MILGMYHNQRHGLTRFTGILPDELGLHLMRPAGVAIGFIQKQARFIYITVAGAMECFKTQ